MTPAMCQAMDTAPLKWAECSLYISNQCALTISLPYCYYKDSLVIELDVPLGFRCVWDLNCTR